MPEPVLTFNDLTLGYGSHAAVHHLSGTVERGSLTALVGANGCGKSTLMKGIVGLLDPISGSRSTAPGIRVAYLPQQSELDRTFPVRVIDLVSLGLWQTRGLLGRQQPQDRQRVEGALRTVGLDGFATRPIDTLSGGQMQRALFARVIVQDADLILLDEPFNAVDSRTIADLVSLISGWRDQGRTVLVVVHDLELVRRHFPRSLLLARRAVAWGSTEQVLTPSNLRKAREFDEAWDDAAPWCAAEAGAPHDHHAHDHAGHIHVHSPADSAGAGRQQRVDAA